MDGAVVRVSTNVDPGFKSRCRRHMWVGFCCWFYPLLLEVFLRVLRFSPHLKNQQSHYKMDVPPLIRYLFIYLFIYLLSKTFPLITYH